MKVVKRTPRRIVFKKFEARKYGESNSDLVAMKDSGRLLEIKEKMVKLSNEKINGPEATKEKSSKERLL